MPAFHALDRCKPEIIPRRHGNVDKEPYPLRRHIHVKGWSGSFAIFLKALDKAPDKALDKIHRGGLQLPAAIPQVAFLLPRH